MLCCIDFTYQKTNNTMHSNAFVTFSLLLGVCSIHRHCNMGIFIIYLGNSISPCIFDLSRLSDSWSVTHNVIHCNLPTFSYTFSCLSEFISNTEAELLKTVFSTRWKRANGTWFTSLSGQSLHSSPYFLPQCNRIFGFLGVVSTTAT